MFFFAVFALTCEDPQILSIDNATCIAAEACTAITGAVADAEACVCNADYSPSATDANVCELDCIETGAIALNGQSCVATCEGASVTTSETNGVKTCVCDTDYTLNTGVCELTCTGDHLVPNAANDGCECDTNGHFTLNAEETACECASDYSPSAEDTTVCELDCLETGLFTVNGTACVATCSGAGILPTPVDRHCACNTEGHYALNQAKTACACMADYTQSFTDVNLCVLDCKATGTIALDGESCVATCGEDVGVITDLTNNVKSCVCDSDNSFTLNTDKTGCECKTGATFNAEKETCASKSNKGLAIGLGLGLGIPVAVIAILGALYFVYRVKSKKAPAKIQKLELSRTNNSAESIGYVPQRDDMPSGRPERKVVKLRAVKVGYE